MEKQEADRIVKAINRLIAVLIGGFIGIGINLVLLF